MRLLHRLLTGRRSVSRDDCPYEHNRAKSALGALVSAELAEAKSAIDVAQSRAATHIVGVGGLLATIISGFIIAISGSHPDLLRGASLVSLYISLIAFVLSTAAALFIFRPMAVTAPDVESLKLAIEREWDSVGWDRQVARFHVEQLDSFGRARATLSRSLAIAVVLEVIGIGMMVVTAILVMRQ
jgi:hypothetical protein